MVAPVIIAAGIAGGAALAGGAMSARQQGAASTDQRHFAREMWKKQMEAENTAHQRQVKDLRAAGLNPILSAKQGGSGTASPMGYAPPQYRNVGAETAQAATAATSAQANAILSNEQGALAQENQQKIRAEVKNLGQQYNYTGKQIEQLTSIITNLQLEADRISTDTDRLRNSAKFINTQDRGKQLQNREHQILMDLFDENQIFKYLKYFGWEGAAAVHGLETIKKVIAKDNATAPPRGTTATSQSQQRRDSQRSTRYQ